MPWLLDDDGLVGHRRHVGAAGGARAHHDGDLRDALRGQVGLVEEDPAEVLAVGEDLVLHRQERAAGVDEVDAGQVVLGGDGLRAQVLLDRDRVVGAALDGRVVGDDHDLAAADPADAGDDAGARARRSSPSYIPFAASGLSSRNGLPGSSSRSTRSRTSSLPRSVCFLRAFSLPPWRAAASRARRSSTSALMSWLTTQG